VLDVSHTISVNLAGHQIFQQSDEVLIFDSGACGDQVGL